MTTVNTTLILSQLFTQIVIIRHHVRSKFFTFNNPLSQHKTNINNRFLATDQTRNIYYKIIYDQL